MADFDPTKVTDKQIAQMHRYADTDARNEAIHHTVGPRATQSASGAHDHRGGNGKALFEGTTPITGSRGSNTAAVIKLILEALEGLGLVDQTTA